MANIRFALNWMIGFPWQTGGTIVLLLDSILGDHFRASHTTIIDPGSSHAVPIEISSPISMLDLRLKS